MPFRLEFVLGRGFELAKGKSACGRSSGGRSGLPPTN